MAFAESSDSIVRTEPEHNAQPLIGRLSHADYRSYNDRSKILLAANSRELFSDCGTYDAYEAAVKERGIKFPLPGESSPRTGNALTDIAARVIDQAAGNVQAGMSPTEKTRLGQDASSYRQSLREWESHVGGAWSSICAPPMPPEKPASVRAYEQKVQQEANRISGSTQIGR